MNQIIGRKLKFETSLKLKTAENLNPKIFQDKLSKFCELQGIDALLITEQDEFLSEYNARQNSQRYHLTGFSGSTGDGFYLSRTLQSILKKPGFILAVDGRYHLQAEREIDPQLVDLVKLDFAPQIESFFMDWIKSLPVKKLKLGIDSRRVSYLRSEQIKNLCESLGFEIIYFNDNEISKAIDLPGWKTDREIFYLDESFTGRSISKNIKALHEYMTTNQLDPATTCLISCTSDDAAWILNARGYHLPFTASTLAYTFLFHNTLVVFLPEASSTSALDVNEFSDHAKPFKLICIRASLDELRKELTKLGQPKTIAFLSSSMNSFLPKFCSEIFENPVFNSMSAAIQSLRTAKTEEEIHSFHDAYLRSTRAIAKTLRWVKKSALDNTEISELDLSNKIKSEYIAEGAVDLSFNTIAATGANGAVIHYSAASTECKMKDGDVVLLDSGAYYEHGFPTDCTRAVYFGDVSKTPPAPWQKQIYTVTLKACLNGMMADFPKSMPCKKLDAQVRAVCEKYGFNYAHGTGHGIGIHVHEEGIRFSTASSYGFTENAIASMEPGIYLKDKGGVRLENAVVVRQSILKNDHFCFENLCYVGYDWDLIDIALLDDREKTYLKEYEAKCLELGTSVTKCPL